MLKAWTAVDGVKHGHLVCNIYGLLHQISAMTPQCEGMLVVISIQASGCHFGKSYSAKAASFPPTSL